MCCCYIHLHTCKASNFYRKSPLEDVKTTLVEVHLADLEGGVQTIQLLEKGFFPSVFYKSCLSESVFSLLIQIESDVTAVLSSFSPPFFRFCRSKIP